MHDPFLSQAWADSHGTLTDFVADQIRQAFAAFERLVARTYDAPWRHEQADQECPARVRSVRR